MYRNLARCPIDWQWLAAAFVVGFVAACAVGFIILVLTDVHNR